MQELSTLSTLAAFAVNNNNAKSTGAVPTYALPIEAAREAVKVKDGNRVAKEDGSQALTLVIGRVKISLEQIAKGATRVNATAEQVEDFTAVLLTAVANGEFDEAIITAQAKADPANKPDPVVGEELPEEAPEDVDLDMLG